jgi:hypothetical protein
MLQSGNHTLYVEGWSANYMLSITVTYQGPDTLNMPFPIPGPAPCHPYAPGAGENNFIICGYNSDSSINVVAISHFYTYLSQVRFIVWSLCRKVTFAFVGPVDLCQFCTNPKY